MYKIYKITSNPTVDYAAEELKKYLRMMMTDSGEISIEYEPSAKDGFRLGLMSDFDLDMSDAEKPDLDDIVYVDTDEKGGIIAGSNPGAALIAVYRYLRFCGCRWIFPGVDGELIPDLKAVPPVKYRKLADYRYRGQCNEGAEFQQDMLETIEFTPKIGMNTYMLEFDNPYAYYNSYYSHKNSSVRAPENVTRKTVKRWKRQCEAEIKKRGLRFHDMGHGWTAEPFGLDSSLGWVAEKEIEVKPEFKECLAMLDGVRKVRKNSPLLSNVCYSNPKTRRVMAEYIADYAERQNNVDFLHIWLADESNGHCECDVCKQKVTADWYIMLLNDIDAEFTRRNLDSHLVFIVYLDTFWPPLEEKLNNKDRFTMLYAPITRLYTETYAEPADTSKTVPYYRNNIKKPLGMSECLGYLDLWKRDWKGDCFCYEYHFMDFQYSDISNLYMSKILYDDIVALKSHGLNGIIEDGSQRSYFPTGFQFYVYGETLFDRNVSFEELKEDYFSHAFGKNYKKVIEYLESLRDTLPFAYYFGRQSKDESKGRYYNPEMVENAKAAQKIISDFATVIKENLDQEERACAVAWQLLDLHSIHAMGFARMTEHLCVGNEDESDKIIGESITKMSEKEIYYERWYDHYLCSRRMMGFLKNKKIIDNLTV
ncbi:MAG: DUF4838 domain-containing protein [Ruminococcaceae bacterium]|nr:DUF4838 domain-containing protein [Oscillospiraceae bacterium]